MAASEERTACRTPNDGGTSATNIPKWKFDVIRAAILQALGQGAVANAKLTDAIRPLIGADDLEKIGKLGWHMMAVKLELEVRGEIRRQPGVKPMMMERV